MHKGVGSALLAALLFGAATPLTKALLGQTSPQVLAGLLYVGSGVGLTIYQLLRRRRGRAAGEASLTTADLPWLAGAIAFGGVAAPLLLTLALVRIPASGASLLLNLEAMFTALLAWLVFRENVDRRIVLGMLAIVAGSVLLSWESRLSWSSDAGPVLVAAACLCWGIDNNLTQRVSSADPVQVAAIKGLTAGSVNLGAGLLAGGQWLPGPYLAGALVLGLVSYGLSLTLFVLAMRSLGVARTGAYFSVAPFVGSALGLLMFRESVTPLFAAAGGLMALGVGLHLSERHEHLHTHSPMRHAHRHVHDEHHRHVHDPGDPPGEPHAHEHGHGRLRHTHAHFPDLHHRHPHA
ncbi:MAG: EamA family transporter [Gemmatimonadetes bacterium]|nr:EamA family transporter [Gemmatimonadota bacterium]